MLPKKALVQKAIKDGSMDRINKLLSLSMLLNAISNSLSDESADILRSHDLLVGPIKQKHTAMMRAADAFFKDFSTMITNPDCKKNLFEDLDSLQGIIFKWAKLDNDWEPKITDN